MGYTVKHCNVCDSQQNHRIEEQNGMYATICIACEKRWVYEDSLADID